MTVKEILENNGCINYLEIGNDYISKRVAIFNSDGSGRIDLDSNLDAEIADYFIEENNMICVYALVSIKGLREYTEMNQKEFADFYRIPIRTVQEWEQGRRKPPSYVFEMMKRIWKLENH